MNFTEKLIEDAYKLAALKLSGRVSEAAMTKEIPIEGEVEEVIRPSKGSGKFKTQQQSIANSEQGSTKNHKIERVDL